MAAADYSADIASAHSMIQEAGMDLVLKHDASVVEPVTGGKETNFTTQAIVGVVLPVSQSAVGKASREIRRRLLTTESYEVLMGALGLDLHPEPGDLIDGYMGKSWEVLKVNPLAPAGTPIIYQLLICA